MLMFFVFFVLLFFSVWFPKSKVLASVIFLFIWQLWGWNTWNGDYDQYKNVYNVLGRFGEQTIKMETGYRKINLLFFYLNLDFQQYMVVYSFIVLSLVFYFVRRCPYPAMLAILYVLIFIMEYVFMRNYLANGLFFAFLTIIIQKPKYYKAISIPVLLFAITVHNTAIFYIFFLLLLLEKMSTKMLFIAVLGGVAGIVSSWTFFIANINNSAILAKISHYTTGDSPVGPAAMHAIIVFLPLLFIQLGHKQYKLLSNYQQGMITVLQKFNIISLLYLPLYFYIPDFARFFRVLFPIELFFILFLFRCYPRIGQRSFLFAIGLCIYSFVIYQFVFSTLKWTYYPLLKFNSIYSLI